MTVQSSRSPRATSVSTSRPIAMGLRAVSRLLGRISFALLHPQLSAQAWRRTQRFNTHAWDESVKCLGILKS